MIDAVKTKDISMSERHFTIPRRENCCVSTLSILYTIDKVKLNIPTDIFLPAKYFTSLDTTCSVCYNIF